MKTWWKVTITSWLVCLMYISVRVVATTVLGGGVFGSDEGLGPPWVELGVIKVQGLGPTCIAALSLLGSTSAK